MVEPVISGVTQLEVGKEYDISVEYDIFPVPLLSDLSAFIVQLTQSGGQNLQSEMAKDGYNVQIISSSSAWDWDIQYVSVKSMTFKYRIKITSMGVHAQSISSSLSSTMIIALIAAGIGFFLFGPAAAIIFAAIIILLSITGIILETPAGQVLANAIPIFLIAVLGLVGYEMYLRAKNESLIDKLSETAGKGARGIKSLA